MARKVRLRQEWALGPRIGDRSGFGQVFAATAADGTDGVVKLIPKHRGANRELLFEELPGVPNVVPIIDSGETASAWVIAMPRADRSLSATPHPLPRATLVGHGLFPRPSCGRPSR
jgi:hypothetical protein